MTEFSGRTKSTVASDPRQAAPSTAEAAVLPVAPHDDPVVRRTKDGWRVGGSDLPDLTSAMVLADLISAELAAEDAPSSDGQAVASSDGQAAAAAAGKPDQAREPATTETSRLRATISQLEHALTARIRVEQAIGVLAERHRIQPRQAFEQLRSAARSRGRRVIDIASDVVASATNPLLQLPDELSRPRSSGRRARQPRGMLSSE
ncbi:MAG TPA: ANTAR domain-containing protein [Streptosporangiaceae bacterium]|nr:ANTAR domain-containing protein [Streptosporangiaceae bacterium]